ncbi:MAG: hypothetical protein AB7G75_18070 [Candidatus Binatia bacterium]
MYSRDFLSRLLACERRVYRLYQRLRARADTSAPMRALWHALAEDERRHLVILQRSMGLVTLQDEPVEVAESVFQQIETTITAAEAAAEKSQLSGDEALQHAVHLEGSELNNLDETWLRSFPMDVRFVLRGLMPEEDLHIRRLVEAVHECSVDKALQEQATNLWLQQQRRAKNAMLRDEQ